MILDSILEEYRKKNNLTVNELITCDTLIKLLRLFGDNDTEIITIITNSNNTNLYNKLQESVEDKKKNLVQVLYENHQISNLINKKNNKLCYFNDKKIIFITKNLLNEYILTFSDNSFIIIKIILNKVFDQNNNPIEMSNETIKCIINNSICYDYLRPILRQLFPRIFFIIKTITFTDDDLFVDIIINNEIKTIKFLLQNNNLIYNEHIFPLNHYQLSCLNSN